MPIGTILTWPLNINPDETWLECNGQAIDNAKYPKLYALMHNTPNYNNLFLEVNSIAGNIIEAGLPNITGNFYFGEMITHGAYGAFYSSNRYDTPRNYRVEGRGSGRVTIYLDASRVSQIYGNSNTVQPPAITVRYFIKAK